MENNMNEEKLYEQVKNQHGFKEFKFSFYDEELRRPRDLELYGRFLAYGEIEKGDEKFIEAIALLDDRLFLYFYINNTTQKGYCRFYSYFSDLIKNDRISKACIAVAKECIKQYTE